MTLGEMIASMFLPPQPPVDPRLQGMPAPFGGFTGGNVPTDQIERLPPTAPYDRNAIQPDWLMQQYFDPQSTEKI
jgi:hypothetical protein